MLYNLLVLNMHVCHAFVMPKCDVIVVSSNHAYFFHTIVFHVLEHVYKVGFLVEISIMAHEHIFTCTKRLHYTEIYH